MHFSPQNFCRQVLKLAGKSYASAAKVSNDLKIVVCFFRGGGKDKRSEICSTKIAHSFSYHLDRLDSWTTIEITSQHYRVIN